MIKRILILFFFIIFWGAVNYTAPSFASVQKTNDAKIKQEIKTILAQPEYNRIYNTNILEKQMLKISEYIRKIIRKILNWLIVDRSNIQTNMSKLLAVAVIFALLVIVALTIQKMNKKVQNKRKKNQFSFSSTLLASSEFLLEEAARLAQAGDYKNAFRLVYLAIVSYLADKKALRFEKSRTNWEYVKDLRQNGFDMQADILKSLTWDFDRKFYGTENCSYEDYITARDTYESISKEASNENIQ